MNIKEIAEALKQKLRHDIDQVIADTNDTQELADKIDLNEIGRIVAALEDIEPNSTIDDRELFIAKFNKAHGTKILKTGKRQKKSFYYYVGEAACCAASISIVFAGANTITGLATGKTICERIVETWQTMEVSYYKAENEVSKIQLEEKFQDFQQDSIVSSFGEIRRLINYKYNFLEPYYMPNGYIADTNVSYQFTDTNFSFIRTYVFDDNNIIYRCQFSNYAYQRSLMGTASSESNIRINDINASVFRIKDTLVTMYENNGLVYTISFSDPDIPEEEIIKMIENMKGSST